MFFYRIKENGNQHSSQKKTLNELEMKCEPCSVMGNQKWEETGERRPEKRSQEVLIIEDR
jgi:hypothetical protein